MKKYALFALVLATGLSMTAGGLDLQSKALLQKRAFEKARTAKIENSNKGKYAPQATSGDATDDETTFAFVKIAEGYTSDDLENAGMNVAVVRGDIAVVSLAIDRAEEFAACKAVKKMSLQQPVKALMDRAREDAGVNKIHTGASLDGVPYTGKGVLTAIVDQGVDPNHVAFLDENGKSRVKYLTYYDGTANSENLPNCDIYGDNIYDEDESGNIYRYPTVDKFETDEPGTYHGTHTMNILAGGYKDDVSVALGLNGKVPVLSTIKNPYYGVAYDSDIAVSCGSLNDACIAMGINGLLDYAYYRRLQDNMPSVLSLSLGSTAGPHDPNGLMNRFLEECGKETIVVIASGNEGDLKLALSKNMTAEDNTMSTMIYPYGFRYNPAEGAASQYNTYVRNGVVMVYSEDNRPFTIKAFVMTGTEGNYRRRATYNISSEEGSYFLSDEYYNQYVGGVVNNTISTYFDGYIGGGTKYDEDLGRYYGAFDYYLFTNPSTGFNDDGSEAVIVGFEITGEAGQRIEAYCDGANTWMSNYGMSNYMDGQYDGTISDMAVGNNVLVVGAYTLRTRWTSLNGEDYGYYANQGFVDGDIGHYTSFGTMRDGTTLPHVCAPGSAVISAMSRPFVESYYKGYETYIPMNFQAKTTVDGKDYYWKFETGTSMSTPFVAGSIALWLEADPTLDIDEVKDIVKKTAVRDDFVEKGIPAQWGAGKFDALAGLKEVIRRSGIPGVSVDSDNDRLIYSPAGEGLFNVFVGNATALDVKVYSMTGTCVFAETFPGSEATVDLTGLQAGIYILSVNGHSAKVKI